MGYMTTSYWQKRGFSGVPVRPRTADTREKWDIAVIGGGLVGVATAYYLKKLGCDRVVILEKEFIGYGASGRNAGFILSGLAEPYSRLVVGMGAQSAKEITRATLENHRLIASAVTEKGIDCGYRKCGSYHLAVGEVEKRELEESVNLMLVDGFEVEYRSSVADSAGKSLGKYAGGFFNSADGKIDPFAFVRGLSDGLDAVEGFEVRRILKRDGLVEIYGKHESVSAEMAVIAVNGYSPLLDSYFEELVFPVRGQMLAVLPVGGVNLGDSTFYANFGYDYFRQVDDEAIIMGGLRDRFVADEVGYDDITSPALQSALEDYIKKNLGYKRFEVEARWGGLMGFTMDGLPLVGSLPHNSSVLAAVAFNGHGFGLGMAVARDLAAAIARNESSDLLKRFSLKRFTR